jgi:hypothetical protein
MKSTLEAFCLYLTWVQHPHPLRAHPCQTYGYGPEAAAALDCDWTVVLRIRSMRIGSKCQGQLNMPQYEAEGFQTIILGSA